MFEIAKNVPMPAAGSRNRFSKYPFKDMEPGDSFLLPIEGEVDANAIKKARAAISSAARLAGVKTRTAPEAGGLRVWKVEDKAEDEAEDEAYDDSTD